MMRDILTSLIHSINFHSHIMLHRTTILLVTSYNSSIISSITTYQFCGSDLSTPIIVHI